MATEIKLPELGEGIEKAQVLSVLVSPGDTVRKDQTVIEVETDKATAEVPSDVAGVVDQVNVAAGDEITVGQIILTLNLSEEPAPKKQKSSRPEPESEPEAEEHEPTDTSETKPKAEPESEPEPEPEPEPQAPSVSEHAPKPRSEKIVFFDEAGAKPTPRGAATPAAPSVRRLSRELGVPVEQVEGTGPGGRVSETDVKNFARTLIHRGAQLMGPPDAEETPGPGAATPGRQPALPDFAQWGEVERKPLSMLRKATAQAMNTAWATVPMVTQFDRADITNLEAFRREYSQGIDTKITVTAVAVKVLAAALKKFPRFNASLDLEKEEIVFKHYVHVGVAVDTDRGLLVPVLRDVDEKNIRDIARELGEVAERARGGKISLEDLRGATCTVSNLGGLGTTYFSPIVNWPQVAILGMGRATIEAVHGDEGFRPRSLLPLAVTYDHRLIDGADAARFLRWIAQALEDPILLALEG